MRIDEYVSSFFGKWCGDVGKVGPKILRQVIATMGYCKLSSESNTALTRTMNHSVDIHNANYEMIDGACAAMETAKALPSVVGSTLPSLSINFVELFANCDEVSRQTNVANNNALMEDFRTGDLYDVDSIASRVTFEASHERIKATAAKYARRAKRKNSFMPDNKVKNQLVAVCDDEDSKASGLQEEEEEASDTNTMDNCDDNNNAVRTSPFNCNGFTRSNRRSSQPPVRSLLSQLGSVSLHSPSNKVLRRSTRHRSPGQKQ
jgi:hypothetical protein